MVLFEMLLQRIVVEVVVWLSRIATVTDEASLMLHATMVVEFVVVVEAFTTEAAQRVALETSLVCGAGLVVAAAHVLF